MPISLSQTHAGRHLLAALSLAALVLPLPVLADVLNVQNVGPGIWAIEGPADQRDAQNLGNNATFGLIETAEGAVLVDPGGT